jgi:hypothetical protein
MQAPCALEHQPRACTRTSQLFNYDSVAIAATASPKALATPRLRARCAGLVLDGASAIDMRIGA